MIFCEGPLYKPLLIGGDEIYDPVPAKFKYVMNIETCTLLCCDWNLDHICASTEIPQKLILNRTMLAKSTPPFLLPDMGLLLKKFVVGIPLHANVFSFTHNAVVLSHFRCFHLENQTKFFLFYHFYDSEQMSRTWDLKWWLEQRSALQVKFITSIKLICYFVL